MSFACLAAFFVDLWQFMFMTMPYKRNIPNLCTKVASETCDHSHTLNIIPGDKNIS